jgi:hypothetical protein
LSCSPGDTTRPGLLIEIYHTVYTSMTDTSRIDTKLTSVHSTFKIQPNTPTGKTPIVNGTIGCLYPYNRIARQPLYEMRWQTLKSVFGSLVFTGVAEKRQQKEVKRRTQSNLPTDHFADLASLLRPSFVFCDVVEISFGNR